MINAQVIHRIVNPDLMKYPTNIQTISTDMWYTLGDLHGNPLKLLHFMIAIGAITMSKADYKAYAAHYISYTPPNKAVFDAMETLLKKVTVNPGASIRLIGDELADRGRDDGLMSSLIYKFIKDGGVLEIMLSNHGELFLMQMERAIEASLSKSSPPTIDVTKFKQAFSLPLRSNVDQSNPKRIEYSYRSLFNLCNSLDADVVSPNTLFEQHNCFKEKLKVFSYDYPAEFNGEPVIYSHAATSKFIIVYLLSHFEENGYLNDGDKKIKSDIEKIAPENRTDADMLPVIDTINRILIEKTKKNEITTLLVNQAGNEPKLLSAVVDNFLDPNDNSMRNNHGHKPFIFGNRITLDNYCGIPVPEYEDQFVRVLWLTNNNYPGALADMTYTKTYKTPELAKKAYAEMHGVKEPVAFSNTNKRALESEVEHSHFKKQCHLK